MESYQGVFNKSKGKEVQHSLQKKDKILYLKTMMYLNVSRLFIQLLREIRKKLKHVHASNNDKNTRVHLRSNIEFMESSMRR